MTVLIKQIINKAEIKLTNTLYNKQFESSIDKLKELKQKHKGERVFILGNGPSLNETNFKLIKDETFFAANTFFKGMKKFDIKPQYWAVGDKWIFKEHYQTLLKLDTTIFITYKALPKYLKDIEINNKKNIHIVKTLGFMKHHYDFSHNIERGIYVKGGIIPIMLQISYYLGFKNMYLLGCDCGSAGKPSHHFYESDKKPRTDYTEVFDAYKICFNGLNLANRNIYNATIGGNLEIFKRVKLEDII